MESYIHYKRSTVTGSYGQVGTSPNQSSNFYNHDSRRSDNLPPQLSKQTTTFRLQKMATDRSSISENFHAEDGENIDESEDQEERSLTKRKKIDLM